MLTIIVWKIICEVIMEISYEKTNPTKHHTYDMKNPTLIQSLICCPSRSLWTVYCNLLDHRTLTLWLGMWIVTKHLYGWICQKKFRPSFRVAEIEVTFYEQIWKKLGVRCWGLLRPPFFFSFFAGGVGGLIHQVYILVRNYKVSLVITSGWNQQDPDKQGTKGPSKILQLPDEDLSYPNQLHTHRVKIFIYREVFLLSSKQQSGSSVPNRRAHIKGGAWGRTGADCRERERGFKLVCVGSWC